MTSDNDLWQVSNWQMPERSRLYRIVPLGKTSIMREALHSVLIRLAQAHTVSPLVLMKREIVPGTRIRHTKHSSSFTESHLKTMNGVGKYAAELTRKLENLTSQRQLSQCSFMLWSGLLDPRALGLLSTHPRWCPLCFLEWRDAGHEPYLPLIWQAAPILVCPVHSMALQYECPIVGQSQLIRCALRQKLGLAGTRTSDHRGRPRSTQSSPRVRFKVRNAARTPRLGDYGSPGHRAACSRTFFTLSNIRCSGWGIAAARSACVRRLKTLTCVLGLPRPKKRYRYQRNASSDSAP